MPPISLLEARIAALKTTLYAQGTDPIVFFSTYVERYKGTTNSALKETIRLVRGRICLGETREEQYTHLAEFVARRELVEQEETERAH